MSKYVIDSATLTSIGDAVREKEGSTEAILVSDIPARILAIETGGGGGGAELPPEAFEITGNADYRFGNNGWNWYIDTFGDKITTNNISSASNMFRNSNELTTIPFDINLSVSNACDITNIFDSCANLTEIPKIVGKVEDMKEIFRNCERLIELKEEAIENIDWSYHDTQTSAYNGYRSGSFSGCYSLRKFPMEFLKHANPYMGHSNCIYNNCFNSCYSLDEVREIPIPHRLATWTSNAFANMFIACHRLKTFTFETNEDGSPIVINTWSKQTIDLSGGGYNFYSIGYVDNTISNENVINRNIPKDKKVIDDASYQALKNDADWYTDNINYSRYNHDSAVETINSLPDLSGGKGSNIIKFKGAAGAKTDGGAINTLTDTEIAVAAAKGWTITLS